MESKPKAVLTLCFVLLAGCHAVDPCPVGDTTCSASGGNAMVQKDRAMMLKKMEPQVEDYTRDSVQAAATEHGDDDKEGEDDEEKDKERGYEGEEEDGEAGEDAEEGDDEAPAAEEEEEEEGEESDDPNLQRRKAKAKVRHAKRATRRARARREDLRAAMRAATTTTATTTTTITSTTTTTITTTTSTTSTTLTTTTRTIDPAKILDVSAALHPLQTNTKYTLLGENCCAGPGSPEDPHVCTTYQDSTTCPFWKRYHAPNDCATKCSAEPFCIGYDQGERGGCNLYTSGPITGGIGIWAHPKSGTKGREEKWATKEALKPGTSTWCAASRFKCYLKGAVEVAETTKTTTTTTQAMYMFSTICVDDPDMLSKGMNCCALGYKATESTDCLFLQGTTPPAQAFMCCKLADSTTTISPSRATGVDTDDYDYDYYTGTTPTLTKASTDSYDYDYYTN